MLLNLTACVSVPRVDREIMMEKFVAIAEAQPDHIWSAHVSEKVSKAIADFYGRKKLNSGKIYGESVRLYDLRNKCAWNIDNDLQKMGCTRTIDVLKNPDTKKPLLTSQGNTIPMTVFLCPDGGVVRVKPEGDTISKFKSQPLASKALRYPFDSKFENFDDEIVKVDNFGNAIPKWTKDLNPKLTVPAEQPNWIEGWADDAHTDLKSDCTAGLL